MALPWFRMHSDAVDDAKLKLLAFEDRWHFVAILCLKAQGELDSENHLDRRVAIKLGIQLKDADEVKRRLMDVDLINDKWHPTSWDKRQYLSDLSTERVRKHRAKRQCNVSETPPDTDTDTEQIQNRTKTDKTIANNFNRFWVCYPKKKSKGVAERAWKKIKPDEELTERIITAVNLAKTQKDWIKEDGAYIPNPGSWLNAKGWLDEDLQSAVDPDLEGAL